MARPAQLFTPSFYSHVHSIHTFILFTPSGPRSYDELLAEQQSAGDAAGAAAGRPPLLVPLRDASTAAFGEPRYAELLAHVAAGDVAAVRDWVAVERRRGSLCLAPPGGSGSSALHHACSRGSVAIAELLLDAGAEPNLLNVLHSTPLHYAAHARHSDVVELLLRRGATESLGVRGESRLWEGPRTPAEMLRDGAAHDAT